jgi:hypothetical protein
VGVRGIGVGVKRKWGGGGDARGNRDGVWGAWRRPQRMQQRQCVKAKQHLCASKRNTSEATALLQFIGALLQDEAPVLVRLRVAVES